MSVYMRFLYTVLTVLILGPTLAQTAPLTVRVDASKGAPRLVVNGKPVRARVFYGQPAAGTLPLPATGQLVSYEFTPEMSVTDAATVHFRLGQTPGDVYMDNIQITDLTTGKDIMPTCQFESGKEDFTRDWSNWPPPAQNTVGTITVEPGVGQDGSGGLHIRLIAPPNGIWPDFHFYHNANLTLDKEHRYRVSFWAKATPERYLTTSFYKPGTTYTYLGGPPGHYESQVRLAAAAGVDFVSTSPPMPWPAPGEPEDWSGVDSIVETTIKSNPHALMIPRIGIYAPQWWLDAHPDELMRWEDGKHGAGWASPASIVFQKDASERLALMIQHLESKYGEHMAGYHPVGQNTGEWFYMDSWDRALNGYSPCDVAAFRKWLQSHYPSVDELRKAWNDNTIDFDNASVPTVKARHSAPDGIFRNPVTERPIIDFVAFQQDSMSDSVCGYAKVVRNATQGKKLVLFFYGYVFEFSPVSTGPGSAGHYELRKLLNCPDIDVLCSPISYFDRGLGQSAPSMTAAESVALAKKMWLNEDDTRTHLTKESLFPGSEHILTSLAQTNSELIRNTAQESLRNFATWWMDLGATGWFDDPGMWAEMKRLSNLDVPMLKKPTPFRPEVAMVLDERSMMRMADGSNLVGSPGIYEARRAFARMGAPYGQYLLDDVAAGRVHAKLYVFVNAWCLDAKTRAALLKATKGSVCIWCYAPGYFDNYRKSPEAMQQLTGFALTPVSPAQALATPTRKTMKIGDPFGVNQPVNPLFAASDAKPNEILATYPDGSTAIAMRSRKSGISIFSGAPGLTSNFLRFASRKAGVHLYSDVDCNIWANGPFMSLHASQDGPVRINTGHKSVVTDVLTGKPVAKGPIFTLNLKRADTRVLKIGER